MPSSVSNQRPKSLSATSRVRRKEGEKIFYSGVMFFVGCHALQHCSIRTCHNKPVRQGGRGEKGKSRNGKIRGGRRRRRRRSGGTDFCSIEKLGGIEKWKMSYG